MSDKKDAGKPRWTLLPWEQLAEVVDVLEYGAVKYEVDGWQEVENGAQRYTDAAMRHFVAYMTGQDTDPDSGKHHLAHAVCSLLFVMWHEENNE